MKYLNKAINWKEYTYIIVPIIIVVLTNTLISFNFVKGISMIPTMQENNLVVSSPIGVWFRTIRRGDFVIATSGSNANIVIKRVIGLPGDTISYQDGVFVVNGKVLDEPYIIDKVSERGIVYKVEEKTLEDGEYFIAGDNRNFSNDSRQYGAVHISRIKRKVVLVVGAKG